MYSKFIFDIEADSPVWPAAERMPDPLAPDSLHDVPLITTRRRLIRLALVAAETGSRFQREASQYDPMAWLLSPREIFDGRDAIEAALDLNNCTRAILLHGLGLGTDADPAVVDDLLTEDRSSAQASPAVVA